MYTLLVMNGDGIMGQNSMPVPLSPDPGAPLDEDHELAPAMAEALQVLEEAGLTAQDLLDELSAAGEEVMRRIYGGALVDDLLREYPEVRQGG